MGGQRGADRKGCSFKCCCLLSAATVGEGGEQPCCSFRKTVILIKRQTNEHSADCLRAKLLKSHQGVGSSHSGKEGCLPQLPAQIGAEASLQTFSLQTAKTQILKPCSPSGAGGGVGGRAAAG